MRDGCQARSTMKTRDRTRNDGKKKRRKPPGEDGKSQVFVWYPACDFYRVLGSSKSIGTTLLVILTGLYILGFYYMSSGADIQLRGTGTLAGNAMGSRSLESAAAKKPLQTSIFPLGDAGEKGRFALSKKPGYETRGLRTYKDPQSLGTRKHEQSTNGRRPFSRASPSTLNKQSLHAKADPESAFHKQRRARGRRQADEAGHVAPMRKKRRRRRRRKARKGYHNSNDGEAALTATKSRTYFEEKHRFKSPTPMNAEMSDLQVKGQTGALGPRKVKWYYRKLVKRYLKPFNRGIDRDMYFDVLKRKSYDLTPSGGNKGGQTLLIQIVNKNVYLLDPYRLSKGAKPFYRSRIREVVWLLNRLVATRNIPDTEFLLSVHDCIQTVNTDHHYRGATYKESRPIFSIVRCSFSDNIPFPMWEGGDVRGGGFDGWDKKMADFQAADTKSWDSKINKAVFRGGNRPSMYFANRTDADKSCNEVGRTRLAYISKKNPHIYDVSVGGKCGGRLTVMKRLEAVEQQVYKYILYAEGNCFWADRINMQIFGPSAIVKQETPCGQFWEPLLKPMVHFVPTDFFFINTTDQIIWAQHHDGEVQQIVQNANEFASNFLSLRGIELYVEVLLEEYTKLLKHRNSIKLEIGAEEPRTKGG